MNFFKEYLPVIINFITTYSGIVVFLVKFRNLDKIKDLLAENLQLKRLLREQREKQEEILKKVNKIENQQRGVYEEDSEQN